jgi:hypothetical protein
MRNHGSRAILAICIVTFPASITACGDAVGEPESDRYESTGTQALSARSSACDGTSASEARQKSPS